MNRFIWVLYFSSTICFSQGKRFKFAIEPCLGLGRVTFEQLEGYNPYGYGPYSSVISTVTLKSSFGDKFFQAGLNLTGLIAPNAPSDLIVNTEIQLNLIPFKKNDNFFLGPLIQYGIVVPKFLGGTEMGRTNFALGGTFKYEQWVLNFYDGKYFQRKDYFYTRNVRYYYFQIGYLFAIENKKNSKIAQDR